MINQYGYKYIVLVDGLAACSKWLAATTDSTIMAYSYGHKYAAMDGSTDDILMFGTNKCGLTYSWAHVSFVILMSTSFDIFDL